MTYSRVGGVGRGLSTVFAVPLKHLALRMKPLLAVFRDRVCRQVAEGGAGVCRRRRGQCRLAGNVLAMLPARDTCEIALTGVEQRYCNGLAPVASCLVCTVLCTRLITPRHLCCHYEGGGRASCCLQRSRRVIVLLVGW